MRLKLLTQLSSGMRRGEMLQLKKKDFHVGKRIMIKIPALIAKFNKARTTFVSSEVSGQLISKLNKLKDNDFVFGSPNVSAQNLGDSYEQNLTRYLEKLGLDMRYESTGHHQITSHSFRVYFITKISRHDENIAKKLAGQKGYMLQYDRLSDEEKLEKYIEFESDLFIYKQKPKSEETRELTAKLEKGEKRIEQLEIKISNLQTGFKVYDAITKLPPMPTKQAYELIQKLKKGGIGKLGFVFEDKELEKEYERSV